MNQVHYRLWAKRGVSTVNTPDGYRVVNGWHLFCSDEQDGHIESTRVARFDTLDHLIQYARTEWPDIDVQVQPNTEGDYK